MQQNGLEELQSREKQKHRKLMEFMDVTEQLLQEIQRKDEVSMKLLLAMRHDTLSELTALEESAKAIVMKQPESEAIHLAQLLQSGIAGSPAETALAEQVSRNKKLLLKAIEADKKLSLQFAGKRSLYAKYR